MSSSGDRRLHQRWRTNTAWYRTNTFLAAAERTIKAGERARTDGNGGAAERRGDDSVATDRLPPSLLASTFARSVAW